MISWMIMADWLYKLDKSFSITRRWNGVFDFKESNYISQNI